MTLAKREKYLVISAACVILCLLIFELLIDPFFEEKKRLARGVDTKTLELKEMAVGCAEYRALKKNSQDLQSLIARRQQGLTLFAFLEREAGKAEIKGHIDYMKPSVSEGSGPFKESMVEMKLNGITLKQLIGYLYRIESPEDMISIKRISIKENKKESGYLDVILQALTLQ